MHITLNKTHIKNKKFSFREVRIIICIKRHFRISGDCVIHLDPSDSKNCSVRYIDNWSVNPYPTAFPYGNGMLLHFYQQQESSTTKTVHRVINKGLKAYV